MKRSKVVNVISQTLSNLEKAIMSNNLKADIILEEIEKYGMLPASVETNGEYFKGEEAKELIDEALSDYNAKVQWDNE